VFFLPKFVNAPYKQSWGMIKQNKSFLTQFRHFYFKKCALPRAAESEVASATRRGGGKGGWGLG
jgi:hypothetical protein